MRDLIRKISKQLPEYKQGQRFILGIDGLSRSGKTTLSKEIQLMLQNPNRPVCLFHMDDFIVDREKRYSTGKEEWIEYYCFQWDNEWLKDNLFNKLKEADELLLPSYDHNTDTQKWQIVQLPDTCLVIIEGVFLQRREWRTFFDYMIYLECSKETRFSRESKSIQKNIDKFRNRYWKAEDYYMKTVNPLAQADRVIRTES